MNKPYEYSTTDQPELVNKPTILYTRHGDVDARGIPKIGNLKDNYQRLVEQLFFATEKCYMIMGKSARIVGEQGDDIIFEFNNTGEQTTISREEAYEMMSDVFMKDRNTVSSKLYIPYFGMELFHKLESKTWELHDPRVKEGLLGWYESMFSTLKENEYPSDQRGINSLFYMSILLDFDKDKQKNLAKYFINNCLNTLYREEDHHYGLNGEYTTQEVWDKLGISVKPIHTKSDYASYLAPVDCKKIADSVGITDEEFNDIIYDACMFKLGDHSKASASGHRSMTSGTMFMDESKQYMNPQQKEEIEDYEYIFQNGRDHSSGIYYDIGRFQRIQLLLQLGLSTREIKEKMEADEKKSIVTILDNGIKDAGEKLYNAYQEHTFDIDMEQVKKSNILTHEDNIFLIDCYNNLILTNDTDKYIGKGNVLGSADIGVYGDCNYNYEKDIPIYYGAKKYKVSLYHANKIDKKILYSLNRILASYDDLALQLQY